jgi:hypothetical protein
VTDASQRYRWSVDLTISRADELHVVQEQEKGPNEHTNRMRRLSLELREENDLRRRLNLSSRRQEMPFQYGRRAG